MTKAQMTLIVDALEAGSSLEEAAALAAMTSEEVEQAWLRNVPRPSFVSLSS